MFNVGSIKATCEFILKVILNLLNVHVPMRIKWGIKSGKSKSQVVGINLLSFPSCTLANVFD